MKIVILFFFSLLLISCSGSKSVYWCGDHPCINKKEKEAYFKKTMIIEKKILDKKNKKNLATSEKIIKEAKIKEEKRIKKEKELKKENKLEQKRSKKAQKEQAKRTKLEEKRLQNEQKKLAKQAKIIEKKVEKKILKDKKTKTEKNDETRPFSSSLANAEFEQLKDQIIKRNIIRSYPDINDIRIIDEAEKY